MNDINSIVSNVEKQIGNDITQSIELDRMLKDLEYQRILDEFDKRNKFFKTTAIIALVLSMLSLLISGISLAFQFGLL